MTDFLERVEQEYCDRLQRRCTEWQVKHPEEAVTLRAEVTARLKVVGQPDPEPGSMRWLMVEAGVNEAIRIKNKWPTVRQFLAGGDPALRTEEGVR